jgi:hypothetical protein
VTIVRIAEPVADSYRTSSSFEAWESPREPNRCTSPALEEEQNFIRRRQLIREVTGDPDSQRLFIGTIPRYIPPVDVREVYRESREILFCEWYDSVKNKGKWDFKQLDAKYEDFGNWVFAFSATGNSHGLLRREFYLMGAGFAQVLSGNARFDDCFESNCDDPRDQFWINNGFNVIQDVLRLQAPVVDQGMR